jgi:hypothetical protein
MRNNKNPLYIIIAVLTTIAMVFSMAACRTAPDSDDGSSADTGDSIADDGSPIIAAENLSYEAAERAFFSSGVEGYSAVAGLFKEMSTTGSEKVTLTLTPERYIIELMGMDGGFDIDKINPSIFEIGSVVDENGVFAEFAYKSGDTAILSADMWVNANDIIMSIPKVLDKYMVIALDEVPGFDMDMFSDLMSLDLPTLPGEEAINAVLNAMFDKYFEIIKDSPVQEGVEVDVNGRIVVTDKTEIVLGADVMIEMVIALLEAVMDSDEILDFLDDVIDMSGMGVLFVPDMKEIIANAIDAMEYELENYEESDEFVTMSVFVSGSSIIKREFSIISEGFNFDTYETEDKETLITIITFKNNNNYFYEFIVEDENSYMRVVESGKNDGGSFTGEMTIEYEDRWSDFEIIVSYENVTVTEKGEITDGEISVSMDESIMNESFELLLRFYENRFVGSLTLSGVKVATAELEWTDEFAGKPLPTVNAGNSVSFDDVDDYSSEMEENLAQIMTDFMQDGGFDLILTPLMIGYMMMSDPFGSFMY